MTDEQGRESLINRAFTAFFGAGGAWIIAIVIVTTAFFSLPPERVLLANTLETWARDVRVAAATPPQPQSDDIVVVALTDETLDLPQFPYRLPVDRSFLAELIRALEARGVRAIGIDILFDRWTEPEKDADLIQALREAEIPVLPIWGNEFIGTTGTRMEILQEILGDVHTGLGVLYHDRADGTVRFHHPIADPDGPVFQSFPAAIAENLGYEVPTETHAIAWRGAPDNDTDPFPEFAAQYVELLPASFFEGKIALIGVDLVDIDRHRTPANLLSRVRRPPPDGERSIAEGRIPGIVVHAHVLQQIIDNRYVIETPAPVRILIVLIMVAIGVSIAIPQWPLIGKLTIGVGISVGYLALTVYAYYSNLIMLPAIMPGFALIAAASLGSVFVGRQERAKRAYIRSAFSRYVAPAVVARLDKNPDELVLGGERREVTFMFTDLAGFTSMSEKLTPTELADLINEYLDGVGDAILDQGGTIDKFIGDGTMSFFGAPESFGDDADRAVACALALDKFSEKFGAEWRAKGVPVGATRIGIHTGQAVVGNFGGRQRFDYTALGDVVNAASRLEGANKEFGSRILISEDTVKETKRFHYRPVGDIVLVGKDEALSCYEPVTAADDTSPRVQEYRDIYNMIHEGKPDALTALEKFCKRFPDDLLGAYHLDRLKSGESGTRIVLKSK